jgi:hypothetical protein
MSQSKQISADRGRAGARATRLSGQTWLRKRRRNFFGFVLRNPLKSHDRSRFAAENGGLWQAFSRRSVQRPEKSPQGIEKIDSAPGTGCG